MTPPNRAPIGAVALVTPGDDRPFPHWIEGERAVLGSAILGVDIGLSADDFYRPDHAALIGLLVEMRAEGTPIDPVTVTERVLRGGRPDRYGGLVAVVDLPDVAPPPSSVAWYAARLAELARHRRDIAALLAHADALFDAPSEGLTDAARLAVLDSVVRGVCGPLSRADVARTVNAALDASGRVKK